MIGHGKHQFGNYIDSPIAKLLQEVLVLIPAVRAKYAADPDTVQKVHTDEMLEGMEGLIRTLHENIFPIFDHGHPKLGFLNLASLGKAALPHIFLGSKFTTREWVLYEAVTKMIPKLYKEAKKTANNRPVSIVICELLERDKANLFAKGEKIPSLFDQQYFLDYVKDAVRASDLFSDPSAEEQDQAKLHQALFDYGSPFGWSAANTHHVMMFEFVIELAKKFMLLPRELSVVIPFMNPTVAVCDLTSGGMGMVVGKFSPKRANLEYLPNPDGQPLSYNYHLTLTSKQENGDPFIETGEFDGEKYYAEYNGYGLSAMLRQIREFYVKNTGDARVVALYENFMQFAKNFYANEQGNKFVASDKARSDFLNELLKRKLAELRAIVSDNKPFVVDVTLQGEALVNACKQAVVKEAARKAKHADLHRLLKDLELLMLRYFNNDDDLAAVLEENRKAGLDMSYLKGPFPDDILVFNGNEPIGIAPIKSALVKEIHTTVSELAYNPNDLSVATERYLAALQSWKNARVDQLVKLHSNFADKTLNEIQQRLDATIRQANTLKFNSHAVDECESAIANIKSVKESLRAYEAEAKLALEAVQASLCLTDNDHHLDICSDLNELAARQVQKDRTNDYAVSFLPSSITNIPVDVSLNPLKSSVTATMRIVANAAGDAAKASEKNAAAFLHYIHQALNALDESERHISNTVANLNAELEFQKSLSEQGPDRLRELITLNLAEIEKNELVRLELEEKIIQLKAKLAKEETNINNQYEKTSAIIRQKQLALREDERTLINEARQVAGMPALSDELAANYEMEQEVWLTEFSKQLTQEYKEVNTALISKTCVKELNARRLLLEVKAKLNSGKKSNLSLEAVNDMLGYEKVIFRKRELKAAVVEKINADIDAALVRNQAAIDAHQRDAGVRDIHDKLVKIRKVKSLLEDNNAAQHVLQRDHDQLDILHKKENSNLDFYRTAIRDNEHQVTELVSRINNKKDNNVLLALNIEILTDIEALHHLVEKFESDCGKANPDAVFFASAIDVDFALAERQLKVDFATGNLIGKPEEAPMLATAQRLLSSARDRAARAVMERLAPLFENIRNLGNDVNYFKESSVTLGADAEAYQQVQVLQQRHKALRNHVEGLRFAHQQNNKGGIYLYTLSKSDEELDAVWQALDTVIKDKVTQTYDRCTADVALMKNTHRDLLKSYNDVISRRALDADAVRDFTSLRVEFDALYTSAAATEKTLADVKHNLLQLDNTQCECHVPSLQNEMHSLRCQVMRTQLAIDSRARLIDYLTQRGMKYNLKDKVFTSDKTKRHVYVEGLLSELEAYVYSGNPELVIKKLQEGLDQYFGLHFRTLLQSIMINAIDFERIYNVQNQPLADARLDLPTMQQQTRLAFDAMPNLGKPLYFKQSIERLIADVNTLRGQAATIRQKHQDDGQTLVELADNLEADIHRYMQTDVLNPAAAEASYEKFKTTFNARLHSRDDVLVRHRSVWPIALNVILGVFTAGIVLLACLAVTKLAYGRATLFFQETSPMKRKIGNIEDAVVDDVGFYRARA